MKNTSNHGELIAIAAVIIVTVLVFVGCQYHVSHNGLEDRTDYDTLIGEWQPASCVLVNGSGFSTYSENDSEIAVWTFAVERSAFTTFDATWNGTDFQGSYVGTTVYARLDMADGWTVIYGQLVNDEELRLTFTSCDSGTINAASVVYTRDGTLPVFTDYYNKVTGLWSGSSVCLSGQTVNEAMTADIGTQHGAAFCGTVSRDGSTADLVGVMTMLETGPTESGIAVDSTGTLWHLLEKNGMLILTSLTTGGTTVEAVMNLGLDLNGDYVQADLKDCTFSGYALGGSKTPYTLTFNEQDSYMFTGILSFGRSEYDLCGALFVSNSILGDVTVSLDTTVYGVLTVNSYHPTLLTLILYNYNADGTALVVYLENEEEAA